MLDPAARGVFVQGFIGALLTVDNFAYPFWVWFFIHVTVAWMASGAAVLPVLEMGEYLMSYAFIFAYGAFCGLALGYALRIRGLVPTHTAGHASGDRYPRLGIVLATYGAIVGVRASVIASGAANAHAPFFDLSSDLARAGYITAAVLAPLLTVAVLVLTWVRQRPAGSKVDFWMWLTLSYEFHGVPGYLAADFVVVAFALLAPQAAWNFLTPDWGQLWAGVLTLGLELAVWTAAYLWFTSAYRRIDDTMFSRKHSYVHFWVFVVAAGVTQFAAGLAYLIVNEIPAALDVIPHPEAFFAFFIIPSLVASLILFFVLGTRYARERRGSASPRRKSF